MNAATAVFRTFVCFTCFFWFLVGNGEAMNITVEVTDNAGTVHTLGPTAGTVDLTPASPPSYSGFTISDSGGGCTARVTDDGVSDGSDDMLHLRCTVIQANANDVTGKITFWATDFTTGPYSPPDQTYETTTKGTLTRVVGGLTRAAKDSWIKISGYWEQPAGNGWNEVGVQQSHYVTSESPVSYGTINKTTAETYTAANNNRGLKGYVEFFLKKSGDKLTFQDAADDGVRVRYAAPGGMGSCPPGLSCNEDPSQCPAGPQQPSCPEGSKCMTCIKESEFSWFRRVLCWFGWRCPCCIIDDVTLTRPDVIQKVR